MLLDRDAVRLRACVPVRVAGIQLGYGDCDGSIASHTAPGRYRVWQSDDAKVHPLVYTEPLIADPCSRLKQQS
jgi:hypothetical protein